MKRHRRLGVLLALVVPFAAAACGGQDVTQQERSTPYVGTGVVGAVTVGGARLLVPTSGDAVLTLAVVNHAPAADNLDNVTIAGGLTVAPAGSASPSLTLPTGQLVTFGTTAPGGSYLAVKAGAEGLPKVGTAVTVTLTFHNAGTATVTVPVESAESGYTTATARPVPLTGT